MRDGDQLMVAWRWMENKYVEMVLESLKKW